jgi:hypothetical protein
LVFHGQTEVEFEKDEGGAREGTDRSWRVTFLIYLDGGMSR